MMSWYLVATLGMSALFLAYWYVILHKTVDRGNSGDQICMDRWFVKGEKVPPPYSWRVLLPLLSYPFKDWRPVSYTAVLLTPTLIYFYVGGGMPGFALALAFIGIPAIFMFNVKWPEYVDGLGQFFLVASMLAIAHDHWSAYLLVACAVLTREALGAMLGVVALYANPWLLIPLAVAGGAAWYFKPQDDDIRHPLTADDYLTTIRMWVDKKNHGTNVWHFATCIQPVRLMPFAVPFTWGLASGLHQWSLLALIPLWVFSIPASGVSRHMSYGFILFAPFVAVLPAPWLWTVVLAAWFWPRDFSVYDETGGIFQGLRKTEAARKRDGEFKTTSPQEVKALHMHPGPRSLRKAG